MICFSTITLVKNPEDFFFFSCKTQIHAYFNEFVDLYLVSLFPRFRSHQCHQHGSVLEVWHQRTHQFLFCLSFANCILPCCNVSRRKLTKRVQSLLSRVLYWTFLTGFIYEAGFLSTLMAFELFLCVLCPLRAQSMMQTGTTAVIFAIGQVDIQASPGTAWLAYSTVSRVNRESLSTPEGSSPTSLLILGNNLCDFPSWHLSRRRWYFYRRHTRRAVMDKGQGGERLSVLITTVWCFILPATVALLRVYYLKYSGFGFLCSLLWVSVNCVQKQL